MPVIIFQNNIITFMQLNRTMVKKNFSFMKLIQNRKISR